MEIGKTYRLKYNNQLIILTIESILDYTIPYNCKQYTVSLSSPITREIIRRVMLMDYDFHNLVRDCSWDKYNKWKVKFRYK